MAARVWRFDIDGASHLVELQHGAITGSRTIVLDGTVAARGRTLIDFGSKHPFWVGPHVGVVTIGTNGFTFNYDFALDGWSLGPGAKAVVPRG